MGSRKRSKSHKTYTVAAFATKRVIRKLKLKGGAVPPTSPSLFFEQNGVRVSAPKSIPKK
jgi:hypothetical protein